MRIIFLKISFKFNKVFNFILRSIIEGNINKPSTLFGKFTNDIWQENNKQEILVDSTLTEICYFLGKSKSGGVLKMKSNEEYENPGFSDGDNEL